MVGIAHMGPSSPVSCGYLAALVEGPRDPQWDDVS